MSGRPPDVRRRAGALLRRAVLTAATLACARPATAQPALDAPRLTESALTRPASSSVAASPSGSSQAGVVQGSNGAIARPASILLLTVGPGSAVWERFGHNAIWVRDPARGLDATFNWGTFDFNQPNFLTRFLTGNTLYWLVGNAAQADIARYVSEDRSVWAQELRLTPAQSSALVDFVLWQSREENRYYRYDYYLDNCSTRVRDAIDSVLGGALRRATAQRLTGTTYRSHTRRLTAGDAPVYTGVQLALGRPADRELTAWEESFLPVRLMEHVRSVRVPGADGLPTPLVASERALYVARRGPERAATPSFLAYYVVAGLALGGLFALLGGAAARRGRGAAAALGTVGGLWVLLNGLLGSAVLVAGIATRHVFMGRNANLAAYNPLALVVLALLVAAVGARRAETRARWAGRGARAAALALALGVVGWVVAVATGQHSAEVFALAVPAHAGLWVALRRLATAPRAA